MLDGQQRVAIARALAMDPLLVLADKPTGNLDTASAKSLFELMRRIDRERGATIVMVTHDSSLAERCDRIAELVDGRITVERSGTRQPGQILANPLLGRDRASQRLPMAADPTSTASESCTNRKPAARSRRRPATTPAPAVRPSWFRCARVMSPSRACAIRRSVSPALKLAPPSPFSE